MGTYKTSSLIDFEQRKPLELDAVWGEPLQRGHAAGASMPRLERLYTRLQELDRLNRAASAGAKARP
jgi:2-dehydropantoate 2-reductase